MKPQIGFNGMCSKEQFPITIENHQEPVQSLKKNISVQEMVVIGEKISSVWSINQFISFPLHSNCKIKSTNSHHYYIVILATAEEGCNLRQCFARPSLIFCNLSRQHSTTTSHKNEKCKFSFKFYNEDVEENTLCKSICRKLQTL